MIIKHNLLCSFPLDSMYVCWELGVRGRNVEEIRVDTERGKTRECEGEKTNPT